MQLLWDVLSGKKRTGVTECTLLVLLWSRDLTALGSLADLFENFRVQQDVHSLLPLRICGSATQFIPRSTYMHFSRKEMYEMVLTT